MNDEVIRYEIFLNIIFLISILLIIIIVIENRLKIINLMKFPWGIDTNILITSIVILITIILIKFCR